jgi:hypothetical protein
MRACGSWGRGVLHTRSLLENLKEIHRFEKRAANMRKIIKRIITKRIGLCGLDSWHRLICFWKWTSRGLLSTLMIGSQRDQEISVLQSFQSDSDAQYPYSKLLKAPSRALKLSGRGSDHSPPSKVEVKNEWRYTSIHPQALTACIGTY